jgi:superfamily I DNA/RNA helicase
LPLTSYQLEKENIPLSSICVVARTQSLLDQYESALKAKGIECLRIQHRVSDDSGMPGLRTATMHRVKGLEFDVMIIAGVNDGVIPLATASADADSDFAQIEVETKERSLLYVAATRARHYVLISCSGAPSKFVR